MKLLHPEVDIIPGRPGTKQAISPVMEGTPLPGSGVIRLTNSTTQNNTYLIRLRCEDNPFWQESWYRLIPLPPAPGDKNVIPAGKRDEIGPQGATVKLYVLSGGTREVLIQFNVPKSPEARAGRYNYQVEIETQILSGIDEASRRDNRVTKLPGVALVRPFYAWSFDLKKSRSDLRPGEPQRVGRRKPAAMLELVVTNESNDWLYCDAILPQPNEMDLDSYTRRLAVRPADPGELLPASETGGDSRMGTQRAVPVVVRSRLKTLRGNATTQPIPLSMQRVNAPTVAPSPEDEYFVGTGKVLCKPTGEKQSLPGERAIVYQPPVPATLTEFFRNLFASGRSLVYGAIGTVIALHIAVVMYQQMVYRNMKINVQGGDHYALGETVTVDGNLLQGAVFFIGNKNDGYDEIENVKPGKKKNEYLLKLPAKKELDGKSVNIRAERQIPLLPYLTKLLPSVTSRTFEFGTKINPKTPEVEKQDLALSPKQATFFVRGHNLGQPGTVYVSNIGMTTSNWTDSQITVRVPQGMKTNEPLGVEVQPKDAATRYSAGSITITKPPDPDGGGGGGTPTIENAPPGPFKAGGKFTIAGKNLKSGQVLIGRSVADSDWSPSQITVTIPSDTPAGSQPVIVQPEGSPSKNVGSISIIDGKPTPDTTPDVNAVSGEFKPGDSLTISGKNLGGSGRVSIANITLRPSSWSATQVAVTIPTLRPGSVSVLVILANGERLSAGNITIKGIGPTPPTINTAYEALIQGDSEKVEELATQQIDSSSSGLQKAEGYAVRGIARLKANRLAEARGDTDQADGLTRIFSVRSAPAQKRARALALAALAFRYAVTSERSLEDARTVAENAYRMDSSLVITATTLAQIYQKLGRDDDARKTLQQYERAHAQEARRSKLFQDVVQGIGR